MRLEVGTVRTFSCVVLTGAVLICAYGMFGSNGTAEHALALPVSGLHCVVTYGLTILAFAACPRLRRIDLVKALILVCITAELVQQLGGRSLHLANVAADISGVLAVFVPSFIERFRALMRADQHEPFSMVYPHDRRRRSRRARTSGGPVSSSTMPNLSR